MHLNLVIRIDFSIGKRSDEDFFSPVALRFCLLSSYDKISTLYSYLCLSCNGASTSIELHCLTQINHAPSSSCATRSRTCGCEDSRKGGKLKGGNGFGFTKRTVMVGMIKISGKYPTNISERAWSMKLYFFLFFV